VVLIVLIMLVWLASTVVPNQWFRRRLVSWFAIGVLLGSHAAFSFGQAVMGALPVIGKNI
jgi:hypothetical protein